VNVALLNFSHLGPKATKPMGGRDFDMMASRMAEKGYRVLLSDLHSNPKAASKAISDADFQKVLVDLVELRTSEGNARGVLPLLLGTGKSWGGGAVAGFAANVPDMAQKLVLVCPDPEVQAQMAQALSMPLRVFWAKGDSVSPFSSATVFQEHALQVVVHAADTGGHFFLPKHIAPILAFATSPI
jgi:pimeloyl-ACP methyl ester carboxylesterase